MVATGVVWLPNLKHLCGSLQSICKALSIISSTSTVALTWDCRSMLGIFIPVANYCPNWALQSTVRAFLYSAVCLHLHLQLPDLFMYSLLIHNKFSKLFPRHINVVEVLKVPWTVYPVDLKLSWDLSPLCHLLHLPWCCGSSDSIFFYSPTCSTLFTIVLGEAYTPLLTKSKNTRGPFSEIYECLKILLLKIAILCLQYFPVILDMLDRLL